MLIDYELVRAVAGQHPYPLLFATISGAHLYGFPSSDSDYDLRGIHLLPFRDAVGLLPKRETVEMACVRQGKEIDLVTHDAIKFFSLMLKTNGYVMEQLFSPLVVLSRPEHEELKLIGKQCITRHHSHHYRGFARTQWAIFTKEDPPRIKPLLYVYRVLLTGIHLMRTGELEANLISLNQYFRLSGITDLIAQKSADSEQSTLKTSDIRYHAAEYERLSAELERAAEESHLREEPAGRNELNDLLIRLRFQNVQ